MCCLQTVLNVVYVQTRWASLDVFYVLGLTASQIWWKTMRLSSVGLGSSFVGKYLAFVLICWLQQMDGVYQRGQEKCQLRMLHQLHQYSRWNGTSVRWLNVFLLISTLTTTDVCYHCFDWETQRSLIESTDSQTKKHWHQSENEHSIWPEIWSGW